MIAVAPAQVVPHRLSLFNLADPAILADPYPFYDQLRAYSPLAWDADLQVWVVSSYALVRAALRERRLGAARLRPEADLVAVGLDEVAELYHRLQDQLLFLDPPRHTRLRRFLAPHFSPARVAQMREQIQAIVDGMLAGRAAQSEMDVIADLAEALPTIVISQLLGLPLADRAQLKRWADAYAAMLGALQSIPERALQQRDQILDLTAYLRAHIATRRTHPQADLISVLVQAEDQGEILSEDELLDNLMLLITGGHETTTNLIGSGLRALLAHPDQRALLQAEPARWPGAIDELLRYDSPAQFTSRVALMDVELDGGTIRQGQGVFLLLAAANRDPAYYRTPAPDQLDVTRAATDHLAFGIGGHYCLGATLARLEAQTALATLLTRFPHLQAAADLATLPWRDNFNLRCLKTLPIRLGGFAEDRKDAPV